MSFIKNIFNFCCCCFRRRDYEVLRHKYEITDLPESVFMDILNMLPKDNPNSLKKNLCLVSKQWKAIIDHNTVYKETSFFDFAHDPEEYDEILKSTRRFKKICISTTGNERRHIEAFLDLVKDSFFELKEVRIFFLTCVIRNNCLFEKFWRGLTLVPSIDINAHNKFEYTEPRHFWGLIFFHVRNLRMTLGHFCEFFDNFRFPSIEKIYINCPFDNEQLLKAFLLFTKPESCEKLQKLHLLNHDKLFRFEFYWCPHEIRISNLQWSDSLAELLIEFFRRKLSEVSKLVFNQVEIPPTILQFLLKNTPRLRCIETEYIFHKDIFLVLEPLNSVKTLYFQSFRCELESVDRIARLFPNLERLHVKYAFDKLDPEIEERIKKSFHKMKKFTQEPHVPGSNYSWGWGLRPLE